MDKAVEIRARQLDALTDGLHINQRYPLIHEVVLDPRRFHAAQDAVGQYLRASLIASGVFPVCDDYEQMVQLYASKLLRMPNVTPNGIVKPKLDTAAEFMVMHKRVAGLIAGIVLPGNKVVKMRLPLVLRLVDGTAPLEVVNRPRANNVMHSDFWTGSCCDLALLLPLLGDVEHTTIRFGEPVEAAENFLQELPSYRAGEALYRGITHYPLQMRKGCIYFQDIYCLHGTHRSGGGLRVSMDWTIQTVDYPEVELRHSSKALTTDNHFDLETWFKVGHELMFLDTEKVAQTRARYAAGAGAEKVALGAAVSGQTSDTSKVVNLIDAPGVLPLAREGT